MSEPSLSPSRVFLAKVQKLVAKTRSFLDDDNDKCILVGARGSVTWLRFSRWNSAPTANRCDVTAIPHAKCLQDPLIPETTAPNSPLIYSLLCDDDCQLRCDSVFHTHPRSLVASCFLHVPCTPKTLYIHICVYRSMCIYKHAHTQCVCMSVSVSVCAHRYVHVYVSIKFFI